ncbi:hypothetical protein TTHERM_000998908 (macronuclear) [Tetrahymena thermophila SB210]|uniref:Uncharacterized protein n=1 Tax=Tetrahymena thermophila (strain SB210) TaxID=312017 RepID=W7X3A3_TETTS|nr:hypothetical protein TTHERM_000998908 [Tetrahymena thermophila SB210]EWS73765.1 hypothetical protein TTHERM_000998908 [Tetrahymena thermophila SB210]|eukprot:XP_012653696.1 hypothetical protein TTHERM_000998908 [Tetrahymena thermophila SB210]
MQNIVLFIDNKYRYHLQNNQISFHKIIPIQIILQKKLFQSNFFSNMIFILNRISIKIIQIQIFQYKYTIKIDINLQLYISVNIKKTKEKIPYFRVSLNSLFQNTLYFEQNS